MTIQKYHCPRAPHRRTVYVVRFPWLWLSTFVVCSSMLGSKQREGKRRTAIQLSGYITKPLATAVVNGLLSAVSVLYQLTPELYPEANEKAVLKPSEGCRETVVTLSYLKML